MPGNRWLPLRRTVASHQWQLTGKWIVLSVLAGITCGGAGLAFQWLTQAVRQGSLVRFAGYLSSDPAREVAFFAPADGPLRPWALPLVLAAGGLLSGLLVWFFAPEAGGPGTDAAIDAFHNGRGRIRRRVPLVKLFASAVTLGTGGSAGREGPIAQIGAGIGAGFGELFQLSTRDRRILLVVGMAAGVGAIFRAPLAGALFAVEILYRETDLEAEALVPAAVASAVAYSTYSLGLPPEDRFVPLFGADLDFAVGSPWELLPYTVLALVLAAAAAGYAETFRGARLLFARLPLPAYLRTALGAGLAGMVAVALYHAFAGREVVLSVLGGGYGVLQGAFAPDPSVPAALLLAIAAGKTLTTALTVGSGGSGGVFGPALVIGGCLGAAVGRGLAGWLPGLIAQPGAFAVVGMAGFFAACARAPISTILMVAEVTGGYALLLPTIWVSFLATLLCRSTLYEKQLPSRLDSPAHRGDFIVDVLEGIRVGDVYDPERSIITVHEGKTLDQIVRLLAETPQHYFPVVDDVGRLQGIFSADDVRSFLFDDTLWHLANARDVMSWPVDTVTPETDLNSALRRLTALNVDELPVVTREDRTRLLGMIHRKELTSAYNRRLAEFKAHLEA